MEKIYYHVVTERPMFLNQKIIFDGNNRSGVYKRVYEKENVVNDIYNNPSKYEDVELDHHTKVALREFALEDIRKKYYPNCPSRLKSLYVSTNYEDAEMWANSFIANGRKVFSIVKLVTDGNCFTGDAYNCFDGTKNKEYNLNMARKYWEKEKNSLGKEPIYETLIDGNIEVVEILKTY